jgi:hypothetical protein
MFILLAAGILLTACSRSPQNLSGDAKLQQRIVGTWHSNGDFNGVLVYDADGHFSSHFTNGIEKWAYQATWSVQDSNIVSTVTQVSFENTTNHDTLGHTTRYRVVYLDDHNLLYAFNVEGTWITNWVSR